MRLIYDSRFNVEVALIGQGEFYISNEGRIMSTTLGSCIAVCLFDIKNEVGGMNHYMLPEPAMDREDIIFGKAKYGINSMEILINEILKLGAFRENLRAKIFGGANMFVKNSESSEAIAVGQQNIHFAKKYLGAERIPILSEDVGGSQARKVFFDSSNGYIKLFRLGGKSISDISQEEKNYQDRIRRLLKKSEKTQKTDDKDIDGKIEWF